jgi:hypothetical protein
MLPQVQPGSARRILSQRSAPLHVCASLAHPASSDATRRAVLLVAGSMLVSEASKAHAEVSGDTNASTASSSPLW